MINEVNLRKFCGDLHNICTENIHHLRVIPNLHLSDHAVLELGLSPSNTKHNDQSETASGLERGYGQFQWDTKSPELFREPLLSREVIEMHTKFLCEQYDCTTSDTDRMVKDFNKILISAAEKSLKFTQAKKIPTRKDKPKRKCSKKQEWYDRECLTAKRTLLKWKHKYERNPYSRETRDIYYKNCINYRKTLKRTHSNYKQTLLQSLLTLEKSNPKPYWKTLDKIKDMSVSRNLEDRDPKVSATQWYNHFKELGTKYSQQKPSPDILAELHNLEANEKDLKNDTLLNKAITMKEVKEAIKNIKKQ